MTISEILNVHKGLIRPQLEFCTQAWYPRLKKNTRSIKNVQRRATRVVQRLQTLSYNENLKKLELPSPEYRRRRGTMIEMFKIGYNRYDEEVITKKANFELRKNFFTIRSAADSNVLPGEVIDSKTLNAFKNNLDKH